MTTESVDRSFQSFQDYIDRRARSGMGGEEAPPYAHPVDWWILRSLNATPAKAMIEKAIDTIISVQLGQLLAQSVFIDQKSFPDLYDVLSHCAHTLDIPMPHAVTGDFGARFNAFTAGTDDYSFVFVTAALCKFSNREETSFIMGHECGHIASGHMVYHTLAEILARTALWQTGLMFNWLARLTISASLLAWERRSEITADRAGLLCCGDLKVAERALLRLVTGLADVENVDVDDYLRRYHEMDEYHSLSQGWLRQAFTTHPFIPRRIEALRLFARSELYYSLADKPWPVGAELLSREELDRQVNEIVKP